MLASIFAHNHFVLAMLLPTLHTQYLTFCLITKVLFLQHVLANVSYIEELSFYVQARAKVE